METKTLSQSSLSILDQYLHFTVGAAVCAIPYFNNNTAKRRGSLPVFIGKGSPQEIREEIETLALKQKIDQNKVTSEILKMTLVDAGIGIDCSGLAYHMLNAENRERLKTPLTKHIKLVQATGFFRSITASFNPVRNIGVRTFAHDTNSLTVPLSDIRPGDMITMLAGPDEKDRNHILIVHKVEHHDSRPVKIYYTHSVAYPSDGKYNTGVRLGIIDISDVSRPITEAQWIEQSGQDTGNTLLTRAAKSQTEIRRLKWWK
jgi:hypothetical protein